MKKLLLIVLILVQIFWVHSFSLQDGEQSSGLSDGIVNKIMLVFDDYVTAEQKEIIINCLGIIVRKSAHIFCFLLLALPTYALFALCGLDPKLSILLTVLFCFAYACADEMCQLFVDGRSGNITDVLVDTSGALLAVILRNPFKRENIAKS